MKLTKATIKDSLTVEDEARKSWAKKLLDYMAEHVAKNGVNPIEAQIVLELLEPILYSVDCSKINSMGLIYAPEDNDRWEWIIDSFGKSDTRLQVVIHLKYAKKIDAWISEGNPAVAGIDIGLKNEDPTIHGGDLLIKAACQWFNERTRDHVLDSQEKVTEI